MIVDTLNSKNFTDKAPNHGQGTSVPLKCTVTIDTSMPEKLWSQHSLYDSNFSKTSNFSFN